MRKNRNLVYVRLMNFDEKANKAFNKAIIYSGDENCAEINMVHLFLALIENTKIGKDILEYLNTSFDMIYSSYQTLASEGIYGVDSTIEEFTPDYLSKELLALTALCSQKSFMNNKKVTVDSLMDAILNLEEVLGSESVVLNAFFEYIGIDIKEFMTEHNKEFSIPSELEGHLTDSHLSSDVLEQKIDNVDSYVEEMIEILGRKKKSNPCLIGEPGVGKTTIVNRFIQRLIKGDVPDYLKKSHVVALDGSTLSSGTKYRGDFEERMKKILTWAADKDVILFLDEIHTFINSGNTGNNDGATAGNMIKRYLSNGSIKVIGTTTLSEYHKAIEKDSAFDRRLQPLVIGEPNVKDAIEMIKNTISDYEEFHNVKVPEELIELVVKLSDRYIKNSKLPDKAYTILDQACAKVKVKEGNTLDTDIILNVVSSITGINVNKLGESEKNTLVNLEDIIHKNLVGQDEAVKTVCRAIRRAKVGVSDENKPLASFLFVGPTGVGKTELCRILSREIGLSKESFIKIDMSEFSEKHSTSRLLGTTAGYTGYGDGGQLTEKVKHNPYSVVLLDEIEKAHPDVFNTFLQLLDEGKLTDGEGTTVDFTNCIIVMTSNAGYGADGNKAGLGFNNTNNTVSAKESERKALKALEDTFRPEFLNRIDNVVIFEKLTKEQCYNIVKLMLTKIESRLKNQNITIKFNKSVINHIVEVGYSDKYGARNLKREIQDTVEDFLADAILSGELKENDDKKLSFNNGSLTFK